MFQSITKFFEVYNWNDHFIVPLSEINLQEIATKLGQKCKISINTYTDVKLPSTTKKGYIFVISGKCKLSFDNIDVVLNENQFCKIKSGDYVWTYDGKCTVIRLWLLDEIFPKT